MKGWNGIKPAGSIVVAADGRRAYQVEDASVADSYNWAVLASLNLGQSLTLCGCTVSRGEADSMARFWRDRGTAARVLPLAVKEG